MIGHFRANIQSINRFIGEIAGSDEIEYRRNVEDTSWADLGAFSNITATGTSTKDLTGIKELVRLKFTFTSTDAADAVHIIVPAPAWRPY